MPTAKKLYTFNDTITRTGAKVATSEAGLYTIIGDEANFFAMSIEGTTIYAVPCALQDGETTGLYVLGATFKPITENDFASIQWLYSQYGDDPGYNILSGESYEITDISSGAAEWLNANATAATKVDVTSTKGAKLPLKGKILEDDVVAVPVLTEQTATPSESAQTFSVPEGYAGFSGFTVNAISTEEKTVTPTKAQQTVTPTAGKYLKKVTVEAIPDEYVIPAGEVPITEPGEYDVDVTTAKTAKVNIPKSDGLNINGVIKQYKVNAGASVNAGDFVEFVNKFGSGTVANTTMAQIAADKLDDSRVLVGYSKLNTYYTIYMVVVSIANGEILIGDPFAAVDDGANSSRFAMVALTGSKAVIGYTGKSKNYAMAMHLSIDGLTVSGVKSLTMSSYSGATIYVRGAAKLTDSKAFITYEYIPSTGTGKLWGGVITATEAETTNAHREFFSTANVSVAYPVALTGDKVVLFYLSGDSSPWMLKALLLNPINGTSILSQYELDYSIYGMVFAAVALSESKVMAVWANSDSQEGYACVIDVNGTSIAASNAKVFCSNTIDSISAVTLNEHKVLVSYRDASDGNGKAVVLTVDGDTITEGEPAAYEDGGNFSSSSPVALDENNVFIAYKTSIGEFTQIAVEGTALAEDGQIGTLVQPVTASQHNVGVAKTAGAEGETVDVFCVE